MTLIGSPKGAARRTQGASFRAVAGQIQRTLLGRELISRYERELMLRERTLMTSARQMWATGQREHAVELAREAVGAGGRSAGTWEQYGSWLVELGRGDAALEAVTVCLQKDPTRLLALEYFIELRVKRHGNHGGVHSAIARMVDQLDLGDARSTRGALDFVIPYGIEPALHLLGSSVDAVTRAVLEMNAVGSDAEAGTSTRSLSEDDLRLAQVIFNINRGRFARAAGLMTDMRLEHLPEASMRRGLRRALRKENPTAGLHLVQHLERIRPTDQWLKSKRQSIDTYIKATEEYQEVQRLTRQGFPLAVRRERPVYTAEWNRAFYLLHNSLPFASAGYATRTHGLLKSLNSGGRELIGITRPGFPFDLPGKELPAEIAPVEEIEGVPYMRLSTTSETPRKRPLPPYVDDYVNRLMPFALAHRPAVIHAASNHWNGIAGVQLARKLGIASVYEVRGLWEITRASRDPEFESSDQFAFMAKMEASAAAGADRVIAITGALRDELVRRGVAEEKISVVPNGVDSSRFRPRPRDVGLERSLGLSGKTIIGYVGSLLDYEGLDYVIEAAAVLRRERSDFHVLIVGDGAVAEDLKTQVVRAGISDVVTFTGRVPHEEVEAYYSIIDIAPLPRRPLPVCEMVSPLKPFEAMAMGKLVLASDVAALDEIIVPGTNGLVFRKGDVGSLANVLRDLLDRPDYVRDVGASAVEWVRANRDWKVLSRRVEAIYRELQPIG